jgi:predicted nucleic acid-binding protein
MPNRVLVDTSFIIALINDKDQYYDQAQALSYKFDNSSLITTDAILLEVGNALAKHFRQEAIEVIRVLRSGENTEVVEIDARLFEQGLDTYERYGDKDWGLVDCISFVVMWDRGISEVLTFDSDFEQAGFTILKGQP